MATELKTFNIANAETSPATATTSAGAVIVRGLSRYDWFMIDAALTGGTGGTLDVYLQREIGKKTGVWVDWVAFPQKAAAAAVTYHCVMPQSAASVVTVGRGTTPLLAASTTVGGHPGDALRVVYKAGASTSAGAAQTITVTCWKDAD